LAVIVEFSVMEKEFCEKELFAAERDAWRRGSISGRNIL